MKLKIIRHSGERRNPEAVKPISKKPAGSISSIRTGFRVKPGMTECIFSRQPVALYRFKIGKLLIKLLFTFLVSGGEGFQFAKQTFNPFLGMMDFLG
jgi:hypothetical protein